MKQMEEKAAMPIQPICFVAFFLQIKRRRTLWGNEQETR